VLDQALCGGCRWGGGMSVNGLSAFRAVCRGLLTGSAVLFLFSAGAINARAQVTEDFRKCLEAVDVDADETIVRCTAAIESGYLSDQNKRGAFNNRGIAYKNKRDYKNAIQDFSAAIELNPNDTKALNNRGALYMTLGDWESAIEDYDRALNLDPNYAMAFKNRGVAYLNKGDYRRAIENYDEYLRIIPEHAFSLQSRGILHYFVGEYEKSERDGRLALMADPDDLYTVIWLYLAQARGGQRAESQLEMNSASLDLTAWPGPVVEMYLGKVKPDALLAMGLGLNRPGNRDRECEANYYVGLLSLMNGMTAEAERFFLAAVATEAKSNFEYRGAEAELKRLSARK
jgi:lipoprotein NlpI